jgi:hypothetical protein
MLREGPIEMGERSVRRRRGDRLPRQFLLSGGPEVATERTAATGRTGA